MRWKYTGHLVQLGFALRVTDTNIKTYGNEDTRKQRMDRRPR